MVWEYKTLNWHIAPGPNKTTLEYVYEAGARADDDSVRVIAEQPRGAQEFVVEATIDDVLNGYGRDGWELVAALPLVTRPDGDDIATVAVRYTLKRSAAE